MRSLRSFMALCAILSVWGCNVDQKTYVDVEGGGFPTGPSSTSSVPPNFIFTASPGSLGSGGGTTNLRWEKLSDSGPIDSCTASVTQGSASNWSGSKPVPDLSATQQVSITTTTGFRLRCSGPGGATEKVVVVEVATGGTTPPPTTNTELTLFPQGPVTLQAPGSTCTATSQTITANQPVVWENYNNSAISTSSMTSTSITVTGLAQGSVTITARPTNSSVSSKSVTFTVLGCQAPVVQQMTCDVSPTSVTVNSGQSTTLNWTILNASSGARTGGSSSTGTSAWDGNGTSSGSVTIQPTASTQLHLNCTNTTGQSINRQVTITVNNVSSPASCPSVTHSVVNNGTIGVNQNLTLTAQYNGTWPSNCQIVWGSERPDIMSANGSGAALEVCNSSGGGCIWWNSGRTATIRGVFAGSTRVFSRVINTSGNNGKWTIVSGSDSFTSWTVN